MKKIILSIFILFISANLFAQDNAQKIDELINKYVEYGLFNGSVLVAQGDKIILSKGYGESDFDKKIANKPETKFRIGSITKQFTSMLVMQLVEKGKIKLDGKISDYLSYYRKDNGDKITVHNLLTHTSGIPNYTNNAEFMQKYMGQAITPKDLIVNYCSGDLEFEPGTSWNYSNSGYIILGAIIEQVTGKKYESVLWENIITPLEMNNTGYEHNDIKMTNQAIGYDKTPNGITVARFIDMTIPFAAGAMYSTVEDLYKWDRALYTDKLITIESKEKMYTPFLKNYAYGWGIAKIKTKDFEKTIYTHSGGINGFASNIIRVIDDKTVIIALSNFTNGESEKVTNGILFMLNGLPYKMPTQSLTNILTAGIASKGVKDAIAEVKELAKDEDKYSVNEGEINNLGYQLLGTGKIDDAIEVFKLNVEMFPDSFNVYDSIGEAYLAKGDKENALINYKKSVELNPNSTSGIDAIKKLSN